MSGDWADVAASNARLLAAAERENKVFRATLQLLMSCIDVGHVTCEQCKDRVRRALSLQHQRGAAGRGEP